MNDDVAALNIEGEEACLFVARFEFNRRFSEQFIIYIEDGRCSDDGVLLHLHSFNDQ